MTNQQAIELLQEHKYFETYPDEKAFLVATDGNVFLPKDGYHAREHARRLKTELITVLKAKLDFDSVNEKLKESLQESTTHIENQINEALLKVIDSAQATVPEAEPSTEPEPAQDTGPTPDEQNQQPSGESSPEASTATEGETKPKPSKKK